MSKPSKRDTLAFLHREKQSYEEGSFGYKILGYLEEIVKQQKAPRKRLMEKGENKK